MNSFRGQGYRSQHTNATSTAIASGDVVVLGNEIGIAVSDIAVGATGVVERCGVHELAATSADAWADGAQLYWDAATEMLTDTAAANPLAGKAYEAKVALVLLADVLVNSRPSE